MAATILVLEDEQLMRELLRLHLSSAGYHVLLAEDAVVAGHMVLRHRPDLILADIELPFMDGLEFVELLKSEESLSDIPVIFVSSRSDFEDRCKAVGAVAFLKKPVFAEPLLSAVARHVDGGRVPL